MIVTNKNKPDLRVHGLLELLEVEESLPNYQRLETVLVVEDQLELQRALSVRLEAAGFEVVCASDGLSALQSVISIEPDLIILDLDLPRLKGFKLLHRLSLESHLSEVPTMVLTGSSNPEDEFRALKWGVKRYLRKPTSLRKVTNEAIQLLSHG